VKRGENVHQKRTILADNKFEFTTAYPDVDIGTFCSDAIKQIPDAASCREPLLEVLTYCCQHPQLFPFIKGAKNPTDYAAKWVRRFVTGYEKRPSANRGGPLKTVPDSIIDGIAEIRLIHEGLPEASIGLIREAHRFSMAIENLVGGLLEEYVDSIGSRFGWICCWGASVRAVDFLNPKLDKLLQVKNRSNSENSSSKAIRVATGILAWYRIDAETGDTEWDELNSLMGCKDFSEEDFEAFIRNTLEHNKELIHASQELISELQAQARRTCDSSQS
jgi:SinI-like restriction endonuclease